MNHNIVLQTRKNLKQIIRIMLQTMFVGCNACGIVVESPTGVVDANQNWVIIEENQAEDMGIGAWLLHSDDFWTPSTDDILRLEEGVVEYLRQNSGAFYRQPPVWERLDEYRRQYIGYAIEGKKIIYGNFFCSEEDNWQQEFVMVIDGGDCYFQVKYDVESGKFIYLAVNGEA